MQGMASSRKISAGFSLIELIMVILIMGIVTSFTAPSAVSMMRAWRVTAGARLFTDQLNFARQTALTKNQTVYVRLYRYREPGGAAPLETPHYRAIQLLATNAAGTFVPLGKIVQMPPSIIIDGGQTLSPIIDPTAETAGTDSLPSIGADYSFVVFRFQPDGSTNLAPRKNKWFITLHEVSDGDSLPQLPANYCTVQIDPYNGHIKSYRP